MKRKIISFLLTVVSFFCFASCGGKAECKLLESQETRVVISVTQTDGKGTLLDCMEYLAERESSFTFEVVGGMVTKINGKANAADFSSCWMLYTTDGEMANTEWGVVEYDGKTLGSAIVGAESLLVETDELYIWVYQNF